MARLRPDTPLESDDTDSTHENPASTTAPCPSNPATTAFKGHSESEDVVTDVEKDDDEEQSQSSENEEMEEMGEDEENEDDEEPSESEQRGINSDNGARRGREAVSESTDPGPPTSEADADAQVQHLAERLVQIVWQTEDEIREHWILLVRAFMQRCSLIPEAVQQQQQHEVMHRNIFSFWA
ncbi:hypothetical protein BD289DRAFT_455546 [Coniella lustricola]|uniref:Uncharacterized protein n=1 Tax=Coniella lustricola TaxID=2025994 RepID=A0A2T2ZZB3_9PEZI|nr:hypothetical protein BD289DRAFT_455546 [Coniella lustricola]